MTKPEFLRGYLLLTTQPWGKAYRTMTMALNGEPTPAELQVEFYYQQMESYTAEGWKRICESFATGDHWPCLDELKAAMKQYQPRHKTLPAPEETWISMEEALAERPEQLAIMKRILGRP
jgi:hypothetical protein